MSTGGDSGIVESGLHLLHVNALLAGPLCDAKGVVGPGLQCVEKDALADRAAGILSHHTPGFYHWTTITQRAHNTLTYTKVVHGWMLSPRCWLK